MKSFLHKLLVLACAIYLGGAHWMLLQVTAWTGMIVARSQSASVGEAVRTTLDGRHPCNICRAIKEGQSDEQEQQTKVPWVQKLQEGKLILLSRCQVPPAIFAGEVSWPSFAEVAERRSETPPTPPPLA